MKITTITLLSAAALGFTACDQAKDAAAEAKAAAQTAAAKAEAAAPDLKAKAASAMEAAKEAGADALDKAKAAGGEAFDKSRDMAASVMDWTKEKLGIPEADGLLDGFKGLFEEAKAAVSSGMTGEKATALKAKWDALYAKSSDTIKNLSPDQQGKLKSILAVIKTKWDELLGNPPVSKVE